MALMNQSDWDAHAQALNDFHGDAFQQIITWQRSAVNIDEHGEDGEQRFEDIELKGLVLYNYFRSWPSNKQDTAGEIDQQSCLVYFNSKFLNDSGYINNEGQFKFNPVADNFILNGIKYKSSGEAQAAQANNKPLLHFLILKREELDSHNTKY